MFTRVAYSNSGQAKPQLRGVQTPPQQRTRDAAGNGTTTGPTHRGSGSMQNNQHMQVSGLRVVWAMRMPTSETLNCRPEELERQGRRSLVEVGSRPAMVETSVWLARPDSQDPGK